MGRKEGVVSQICLNSLFISPALIVTGKSLLLVNTSQLPPVQSVISGFVPSATSILFLVEQLEEFDRAIQP